MKNIEELKKILKASQSISLVVVGSTAKDFDFTDKTIVSASIVERDLFDSEDFYLKCISKPLLLIDGLDTIGEQEQEKFVGLIKDRSVWSSRLPENVQIVITVKSKRKLSKKIQNLIWFWVLN